MAEPPPVQTYDPDHPLHALSGVLEIPALFVAVLVIAYATWSYFPLGRHRLFLARANRGLGLVRVAVATSGLWFYFVLQTGAASDIVGFYTWLYVAIAFACLLLCSFRWPILELYQPADVVERRNWAAAIVLAGFVWGTAFAFGGALTGEGPGWYVVIVFFVLAYLELRANLGLVQRLAGGLARAVRLDRDVSAAVLLAGVAVASGLVAGRAAAGDFHGWAYDLKDYARRLWPLLAIAAVAAATGFFTDGKQRRLPVRATVAAIMVVSGFAYYFLT